MCVRQLNYILSDEEEVKWSGFDLWVTGCLNNPFRFCNILVQVFWLKDSEKTVKLMKSPFVNFVCAHMVNIFFGLSPQLSKPHGHPLHYQTLSVCLMRIIYLMWESVLSSVYIYKVGVSERVFFCPNLNKQSWCASYV